MSTRRGRVAVVAAILLAGAGAAARAQRFKSVSELVLVDALVRRGGAPVTGLRAEDFEILDNGVPQQVSQLYLEQLPITVFMVLDTSSSVKGERLDALKAGARTILQRLRPADRAGVLAFSHQLRMPAAAASDVSVARAAVDALDALGSTALRDAVLSVLTLRTAETARTLVVLFSDGLDTSSIASESQVMNVARRSDATVYAIGVRGRPAASLSSTGSSPADHRFLDRLADETGGRLLYAERNRDIERLFASVIEEFNSRYVLGYVPSGVSGSGWHRLEVRLRTQRGTVLARRGYQAP